MSNNDTDVIRVSKDFIDFCDELKIHKNQSYAEICDKFKKILERYKNLKEKLNGVKI